MCSVRTHRKRIHCRMFLESDQLCRSGQREWRDRDSRSHGSSDQTASPCYRHRMTPFLNIISSPNPLFRTPSRHLPRRPNRSLFAMVMSNWRSPWCASSPVWSETPCWWLRLPRFPLKASFLLEGDPLQLCTQPSSRPPPPTVLCTRRRCMLFLFVDMAQITRMEIEEQLSPGLLCLTLHCQHKDIHLYTFQPQQYNSLFCLTH